MDRKGPTAVYGIGFKDKSGVALTVMADAGAPAIDLSALSNAYYPAIEEIVDWGQFSPIASYVEAMASSRCSGCAAVSAPAGATFASLHGIWRGTKNLDASWPVGHLAFSARSHVGSPKAVLIQVLNWFHGPGYVTMHAAVEDVISELNALLNQTSGNPDERPLHHQYFIIIEDLQEWPEKVRRQMSCLLGIQGTRTPINWILDYGEYWSLSGVPDALAPSVIRVPGPVSADVEEMLRQRVRAAGLTVTEKDIAACVKENLRSSVQALSQLAVTRRVQPGARGDDA